MRIKVPNYGEFGLGSTVFHFTEPLTDAERRTVRLTMTTPRANELVAAAATVSRDGRDVTLVAATARRRSSDRRLHGLAVDGEARSHSGESKPRTATWC